MSVPQFQFYTSVYRGRYEREFDLEVTYRVNADDSVEILEVTHNGRLFDTTAAEDDGIQDQAERHADADLAAWADDQDYDDSFTPLAWAAEAYVPAVAA